VLAPFTVAQSWVCSDLDSIALHGAAMQWLCRWDGHTVKTAIQ